MLLAHHLLEAAGAVLAGEHDIGHALHSTVAPAPASTVLPDNASV
jgi:hypothetical protein